MPRRPSDATRRSIGAAAESLFQQRGYSRTSVREIAAAAETDPALVIRHFGSKESLFLETMRLTIDGEPLLEVPLDLLGERFVRLLLESGEQARGVYLALVQGSDEGAIGDRLRLVHETTFVEPLRARLGGPDADLRARLAADHRVVADRYGRLLQQVLTG